MNRSKSFESPLFFSVVLLLAAVRPELLFANRGLREGTVVSASREWYTSPELSDDALATGHRVLAVARGGNYRDIPSGYFAQHLSHTFLRELLERRTLAPLIDSKEREREERFNGVLVKSVCTFNERVKTLVTAEKNKLDPKRRGKIRRLPSAAGLTAVVLAISNRKPTYKISQNGNSRVIIFRLKPSGRKAGRYFYKPVYFSGPYKGKASQVSTSSEATRFFVYNPQIDEVPAYEGDVVLVCSDGLLDNVGVGMMTHILNFLVAAGQVGLSPKKIRAEIENLKTRITLSPELRNRNWMDSAIVIPKREEKEEEEVVASSNGGFWAWIKSLWGPGSTFRKVLFCAWEGSKQRVGQVIEGYAEVMYKNRDKLDVKFFAELFKGAPTDGATTTVGWTTFLIGKAWQERQSIKNMIICLWNDRRADIQKRVQKLAPSLGMDAENMSVEWFERLVKEANDNFENKISASKDPNGVNKKALAKEVIAELLAEHKGEVLERGQEEAMKVLGKAIQRANLGEVAFGSLELVAGKLLDHNLTDEERKVLSLLKQFAAAEKEALVMKELQKKSAGMVAAWELGHYQLFDSEINFFETETSNKVVPGAHRRVLMNGNPFKFSDNDWDTEVHNDYLEFEKATQISNDPILTARPRQVLPTTYDKLSLDLLQPKWTPENNNQHMQLLGGKDFKEELERMRQEKPWDTHKDLGQVPTDIEKPAIKKPATKSKDEKTMGSDPLLNYPLPPTNSVAIAKFILKNRGLPVPLYQPGIPYNYNLLLDSKKANGSKKPARIPIRRGKNGLRKPEDVLDLSAAKNLEELFELRVNGAGRIFEENLGRYLMSFPSKFGLSEDLLGPRLEFLLEGSHQFTLPELRHFAANFDSRFLTELLANFAQRVSQCSGCMTPFCAANLREDPTNTDCSGGRVSDIAVVASLALNLKTPNLSYTRKVAREVEETLARSDTDLEEAFLSALRPQIRVD